MHRPLRQCPLASIVTAAGICWSIKNCAQAPHLACCLIRAELGVYIDLDLSSNPHPEADASTPYPSPKKSARAATLKPTVPDAPAKPNAASSAADCVCSASAATLQRRGEWPSALKPTNPAGSPTEGTAGFALC